MTDDTPREGDAEPKDVINRRVQDRYDELRAEGKHGHYETMFCIVHEERGAALREVRAEIERIRKVGARIAMDKALARAEIRRLRAVAEPDEWRTDRPGWYWVKRSFEENTWRPAHWIVTPECTGWEGYTHPEEIVEIGRYIPAPPAASQEGET